MNAYLGTNDDLFDISVGTDVKWQGENGHPKQGEKNPELKTERWKGRSLGRGDEREKDQPGRVQTEGPT